MLIYLASFILQSGLGRDSRFENTLSADARRTPWRAL